MKKNLSKCDHPGCKNHVTHPCEKCGYQTKKGNEMKTKPETTMHDLICIGQIMSNILFNLAQKDKFKEHHETLNQVRKQWDEALQVTQKPETTFWLARCHHNRKGGSVTYKICRKQMLVAQHSENYKVLFWLPGEAVDVIVASTAKLIGLPTLRKGQQVQIRRMNNGFEIVKGNKYGK